MHCVMVLEMPLFIDFGSFKEQLQEISQKENIAVTWAWPHIGCQGGGEGESQILKDDLFSAAEGSRERSNI